ncbi:MAG: response regulator [Rhodospirillaceae bacterium]|jgi:CheY-like chemotaxis protein|nr:response regulator [Rhodospirillaceae bacterium]MBT6406459.1 response regulator [Rhodospirillaceae bacterium]MBT7138562.1 response regulator [Rhodospirillaceae bacterium]
MKNEMMPKVLVVDDDPNVRHSLKRDLQRKGYKVVCAKDGHEALKRLEFNRPDIILTDVFMPEMDGLELIIKIKKQAPDTPVIAMSGGGAHTNNLACMLSTSEVLGAAAILHKPFSQERLNSVLSGLLI